MSLIRFVQVHHLRLGLPLKGISGGPDWLKSNVADAVRGAVRSLFEVASSSRAHFIFLTGRLTENADDLDSVIQWLSPQLQICAHQSIPLVMAVETPREIGTAHRIGAIPLKAGESLHAVITDAGQCQLEVIKPLARNIPRNGLVVSTDTDSLRSASQSMRILSVPQLAPISATSTTIADGQGSRFELSTVQDGMHRVPSVSPQATTPEETGAMGCHLVEANPQQAIVQFQFRALDRVRYHREQYVCPHGIGMDQVVKQLADRSRQLSQSAGRICIVDWVISGRMNVLPGQMALCDENEVLQKLRSIVQSGHHGAWPRRVLYSESTTVAVSDQGSPVIAEYLRMLNGRRIQTPTEGINSPNSMDTPNSRNIEGSRATIIAGTDAVLGVELLSRVA